MELENTADNVEQVVRITLMRCEGDPKKLREELEHQQKKKVFYERTIAFLRSCQKSLDDALEALVEALVEASACVDVLLDVLKEA